MPVSSCPCFNRRERETNCSFSGEYQSSHSHIFVLFLLDVMIQFFVIQIRSNGSSRLFFFFLLTITRDLTCHQCEHRVTVLVSKHFSLIVSSFEREREGKKERKIVSHLFTGSLFEYRKRQKKKKSTVFCFPSLPLSLSRLFLTRSDNERVPREKSHVQFSFCTFCFIIIVSATRN